MKKSVLFVGLVISLILVSCASTGVTGSLVCVEENTYRKDGVDVSVVGNNITDGYCSVAISVFNNSFKPLSVSEQQILFYYRDSVYDDWTFLSSWNSNQFARIIADIEREKTMRAGFLGDLLTFNVALFDAIFFDDEYWDADVELVDFLTDVHTLSVGLSGVELIDFVNSNMFKNIRLVNGSSYSGFVFFKDVAASSGQYMVVIDLGRETNPSFIFRKNII